MPALNLAPALSLLLAFRDTPPVQPLRAWWRQAGRNLRPARPRAYAPRRTNAQDAVIASGRAGWEQRATVLHEPRRGPVPTIVLGGFVPDSTEQVFLLRGQLVRHGSVYYFNYPRHGFSAELIAAQLADLIADLNARHAGPPVLFAVSFGAALVIDALRRHRDAGRPLDVAGVVLVSPVITAADIIAPGTAKPSTLLGRALQAFLRPDEPSAAEVEKARNLFLRMFDAGAQNKAALIALMSAGELRRLHTRVKAAIRDIDGRGAHERVRAMLEPPPLTTDETALTTAPTLVLYAEREDAVLDARAPSRLALDRPCPAGFPAGITLTITQTAGPAVQHASLIFHAANFLPPITAFYQRLKPRKFLQAA